jgi:acyl carrier protein
MGEYVVPSSEIEQVLADLWAELLQVDRVGATDNCFELGGHSLHGVKRVAKILERFGVELSANAVFQHPSVQQMAALVSARQDALNLDIGDALLEEGVIQARLPGRQCERPGALPEILTTCSHGAA